jgi:ferric-dicitrate binding protein FerR (iron transport regulator)
VHLRSGRKKALTAAAVAGALACYPQLAYNEPPAHTYTAETRQLKTGDGSVSVQSASVTPDFFRSAGIHPLLGRFIVEAERVSATQVAVLSHDVWVQRFRSSPEIIGQGIELDGRTFIVVGVAPSGFTFPGATSLWTSKGK